MIAFLLQLIEKVLNWGPVEQCPNCHRYFDEPIPSGPVDGVEVWTCPGCKWQWKSE